MKSAIGLQLSALGLLIFFAPGLSLDAKQNRYQAGDGKPVDAWPRRRPAEFRLDNRADSRRHAVPKASAIGFATIPPTDEGGLSIAALNRMIAGAVRGVKARR